MILYFLKTPSSFEKDWRGFAINAAGHALAVGALPILWWPPLLAVTLTLYAVWEAVQWNQYNAELWDCFHDWAFVAIGAALAFAPTIPLALAIVAFYLAGVFRRL